MVQGRRGDAGPAGDVLGRLCHVSVFWRKRVLTFFSGEKAKKKKKRERKRKLTQLALSFFSLFLQRHLFFPGASRTSSARASMQTTSRCAGFENPTKEKSEVPFSFSHTCFSFLEFFIFHTPPNRILFSSLREEKRPVHTMPQLLFQLRYLKNKKEART